MSKSATEQYQIKKKRKHPNNKNNNKNNHYNKNKIGKGHKRPTPQIKTKAPLIALDANSQLLQLRQHPSNQQQKPQQQLNLKASTNTPRSSCSIQEPSTDTLPSLPVESGLRDRVQVLQPHCSNMPLSQGYYVQSGATKRSAYKTPLAHCTVVRGSNIDDANIGSIEAKRRPFSEQFGQSNKSTSAAAAAFAVAASAGVSAQSLSAPNNCMQFYYLLAESLARCGRLNDAFDMYAFIACAKHDGSVPLDQLSTLASSLTAYMRELKTSNPDSDEEEDKEASDDEWLPSNDTPAAAITPSCNLATPTVPDAVVGASLNDLHAPTREHRIASPTLAEDYDPLLCPLCRDILRCPVTTNCGHTFCRQCCETITQCNICHIKFPRSATAADELMTVESPARTYANNTRTTYTTTTSASVFPTTASGSSHNATTSASYFGENAPLLTRRLQSRERNLTVDAFERTANMRLQLAAPSPSPTTVTTATVASTTATATTTMAAANAMGGGGKMKFMPDVLVRRLVEKWWGPDLQAKKINETAASYMHLNLLDEALRYCNASLEKSPTNFNSLLLRAEVLRKLNHCQSSLADVDSALKSRYTSPKAHYMRALALSELGRYDESLYENCLAISLDKSTQLTSSELFQHDLAKNLQKLLAQSPKSKLLLQRTLNASSAPYSVLAEHHLRRRKQISMFNNSHADHLSSFSDDFIACDSNKCDIMADDDFIADVDDLGGCNDKRYPLYAGMQRNYDFELRRQTSRKHCRRKWLPKETELLPSLAVDDVRCSELFRGALERAEQEVESLRKLESSGDSPYKQLLQLPSTLIDASDFDCVLCCRTFWKPVVTPCGHTYCWVCLDRCMDYASSCPLCMSPLVEPTTNTMYQGSSSPVPFVLAKRKVTKFLEAAMKRFIPDIYEKRFRQEIDLEPSVPVFICTTAFPYVPCPLFVYEPRYRLMVRRAVESGEKQFGIVQSHSGKSRYFDVGTILDIRDCVLLGDGCSILSTIGCKRFKILARNEKDGYETAKVEYIYDEAISDENVKMVSNMHATVLTKATEWFESLSEEFKTEILQSFGEMPAVEENWESIADGPAWAWWIIALLPLNQQLKVDILATTSLEKRLRAIEKTLDYLSGTLRRAPQHDCSVVVVQQQQHQQQQQQHQEQECDTDLPQACQTDQCCQLATGAEAHHSNGGERPAQLML